MNASQAIVLAPGTEIDVMSMPYLSINPFLVDASGSMRGYREAPLVQTNALLEKLSQDQNADVILVGVWTFASLATCVVPFTFANRKPRLPAYTPDGETALYETGVLALEALLSIAVMREAKQLTTNVRLTVLTDGDDSWKRQDMIARLHDLVKAARARDWILRVEGFGVDAHGISQDMGFVDRGQAYVPPQAHQSGGVTYRGTRDDLHRSVMTSVIDISEITNLGRTQSRMPKKP